MSTLLTRMRPLAAQTSRIRLPHRGLPHRGRRVQLSTTLLPATDERLATDAEVATLRAMFAVSAGAAAGSGARADG